MARDTSDSSTGRTITGLTWLADWSLAAALEAERTSIKALLLGLKHEAQQIAWASVAADGAKRAAETSWFATLQGLLGEFEEELELASRPSQETLAFSFGELVAADGDSQSRLFPSPEELALAELEYLRARRAKLALYKQLGIRIQGVARENSRRRCLLGLLSIQPEARSPFLPWLARRLIVSEEDDDDVILYTDRWRRTTPIGRRYRTNGTRARPPDTEDSHRQRRRVA